MISLVFHDLKFSLHAVVYKYVIPSEEAPNGMKGKLIWGHKIDYPKQNIFFSKQLIIQIGTSGIYYGGTIMVLP